MENIVPAEPFDRSIKYQVPQQIPRVGGARRSMEIIPNDPYYPQQRVPQMFPPIAGDTSYVDESQLKGTLEKSNLMLASLIHRLDDKELIQISQHQKMKEARSLRNLHQPAKNSHRSERINTEETDIIENIRSLQNQVKDLTHIVKKQKQLQQQQNIPVAPRSHRELPPLQKPDHLAVFGYSREQIANSMNQYTTVPLES